MGLTMAAFVVSLMFLGLACYYFPPWFKRMVWKLCRMMVLLFLAIIVGLFLFLLWRKDKQRNEKILAELQRIRTALGI